MNCRRRRGSSDALGALLGVGDHGGRPTLLRSHGGHPLRFREGVREVVDLDHHGGLAVDPRGRLQVVRSKEVTLQIGRREDPAANLFDMGETPGLGQAGKLAHQVVVATGVGARFVVQNWERIRRDYTEGNAYEIVCKDLRSILNAAAEERVAVPITALGFNNKADTWDR